MTVIKPLVLDVDGTFLKTDMLLECFWAGLGQAPLATLAASVRHFRDPARLKAELAAIASLRTELLPVNPHLAELALQSHAAGREVVLASASDRTLVAQLAADYGLSQEVFASDGATNMKGAAKAEALVGAFGDRGFDYAGDSRADLAVWPHAENALVVGRVRGADDLAARGQNVVDFPGGWDWRGLLKALRPHQWVKNILLILPMIAAHRFDLATFLPILAGIVAFSAAASSIYVVNDLLDLEADRLHPTKCQRPFASGAVPILVGMAACCGAGGSGPGDRGVAEWRFPGHRASLHGDFAGLFASAQADALGRCGDIGRALHDPRGSGRRGGSGRGVGLHARVHLPGLHHAGLCQAADRTDACHDPTIACRAAATGAPTEAIF